MISSLEKSINTDLRPPILISFAGKLSELQGVRREEVLQICGMFGSISSVEKNNYQARLCARQQAGSLAFLSPRGREASRQVVRRQCALHLEMHIRGRLHPQLASTGNDDQTESCRTRTDKPGE